MRIMLAGRLTLNGAHSTPDFSKVV